MHVWPIYTPMLLYMCIHTIHTYEMACLIDATYYRTILYTPVSRPRTGRVAAQIGHTGAHGVRTVKIGPSVGGGGGDAGGGCALRASRGLAAPSGGVQIERLRRGALGSQPALEAQGVLYGVGEGDGLHFWGLLPFFLPLRHNSEG